MILPAHLLWGIKLPEKILRHVTRILMYSLIKFGIKNYRFYIEIILLYSCAFAMVKRGHTLMRKFRKIMQFGACWCIF